MFVPDVDKRPDRTEDAFRLVKELKERKWKGKIVLHHDGSGRVAKVEKSEYV